ncbi:MAG: AAA family ATPase [Thiomicrorhabdus sp.]|nr:AAA family ATPase [Thiomicrorhabdus sp.]
MYTVSRGDGITKVTGEVGSGKTMLLRLLADSLPKNFQVLYINTPNLSPKDMLMHICTELGLNLEGLTFKYALLDMINKELVRLYSEGLRVVMLIDEAQAMTFDTLEEIRLLSNLETSEGKLLQIVLFGQPELDVALANDKIRQLKSRISYSIFIPTLSAEEVNSYLNYRVRKSLYEGLDIFDIKVSREVHKLSAGIPRTINMIADKLLMSAYSCDDKKVTKKHVAMLPKNMGVVSVRHRAKYFKTLFLFVILLGVLLSSFFGVRMFDSSLNELVSSKILVDGIRTNDKRDVSDDSQEGGNNDIEALNHSVLLKDGLKSAEQSVIIKDDFMVLDSVNVKAEVGNVALTKEPPHKINRMFVKEGLLQKRLIDLHLKSVDWLQTMPKKKYIIQLASPHVNTLDEAIDFYKKQDLPLDSIHFLIDLGVNGQVNRFRVLYLTSASYSTLQRIISELPLEVLISDPYVVTVGGVLENVENTQFYLKQHGIINVN